MMSRPSLKESTLVGRSMRISGTTRVLAAALAGGAAINAAVAIQFVGVALEGAIAAVFFVAVAAGAWGIARDLCSRSAHAISSLRSIGATKSSILSAVLFPVLTFGCGAALLGALVGTVAGEFASTGGYSPVGIVFYTLIFAVAAATASGAGAYAGVRGSWRS